MLFRHQNEWGAQKTAVLTSWKFGQLHWKLWRLRGLSKSGAKFCEFCFLNCKYNEVVTKKVLIAREFYKCSSDTQNQVVLRKQEIWRFNSAYAKYAELTVFLASISILILICRIKLRCFVKHKTTKKTQFNSAYQN